MKLVPILTEKSLKNAKEGKYSFWVNKAFNKYQIKKLVEESFEVHVRKVWVAKKGENLKRGNLGKRYEEASKKAVVTLAEKEKLDLFEEKK